MSIKKVLEAEERNDTRFPPDHPLRGLDGLDYDMKALEMADAAVAEGVGNKISNPAAMLIANALWDGSESALTHVERRTFIKIASEYEFESRLVRKKFVERILKYDAGALNIAYTNDLLSLNLDAVLKAAQAVSDSGPEQGSIDAKESAEITAILKGDKSQGVARETARYILKYCTFSQPAARSQFAKDVGLPTWL